tara:strand:+ start:542 stop:916 length:375 start_codon:yes stop_codon:yes gene_type:complete
MGKVTGVVECNLKKWGFEIMWLFCSNGFVSIVAHRELEGHLLVRARKMEHLKMLFPNSDIFTLQDADYPHRAVVSRIEAADAILKQLELLQYDNFKKSIDEKKYSNTCNTVWKVLFDYGRKFRK